MLSFPWPLLQLLTPQSVLSPRRGHFCISDEQYFGTALSYILTTMGEDIGDHLMGTVAVAMCTSGGGFDAEDVTEQLLVELRTGSDNSTMLPNLVNHYGDCHAHDRCDPLLSLTNVDTIAPDQF